LRSLNPKNVLERGYSIAMKNETGEIIKDAKAVSAGETLRVLLARGRLVCKVKKNVKSPPIKVVLKFQNIPRPCIKVFAESLRELEKHLMPIGDKELELVISVEPRLRSYYMFLTIDFNLSFYRRAMKRFSQPETIDLLPFNSCIWAMRAYKQFLLRSLENKGESQGCSFIKKMAICLVLRR